MSEAEILEVLTVVPMFCISDEKGRPVLMKSNSSEEAVPQQLFFTDVDVARAHAQSVQKHAADASAAANLRIASINLGQIFELDASDREIKLFADPREVHVARTLLLRAGGFVDAKVAAAAVEPEAKAVVAAAVAAGRVLDFGNETAVAAAAQELAPDLANGIPLFTLDQINVTVGGKESVQPWFFSFADLVRAYVNSTNGADDEQAAKTFSSMLSAGGITVGTLAGVVATMRSTADDVKRPNAIFLLPPASSLELLRQQQQQQEQPQAPSTPADEIAAAASRIDDDDDEGLFD